jgi:hypothetical protein
MKIARAAILLLSLITTDLSAQTVGGTMPTRFTTLLRSEKIMTNPAQANPNSQWMT